MEDVDELMSWAAKHGSALHPSVEIYLDETTGLSFRAKNTIERGKKLAICNYQTTLSWLNVAGSDTGVTRSEQPFPSKFVEFFSQNDPHVISHFFLAQQYLLKHDSFWWPYLKTLPQPGELSIPTLWPESDQKYFAGTNVEPALKKRNLLWKTEWLQAKNQLSRCTGNWDPFSFELYQWAAAIFGSRSFRPSLTILPNLFSSETDIARRELIQSHIANDRFSILFPVLDIGNHNSVDRVQWYHNEIYFSFSSLKEIQKDEQIYNFYGDKSNSELLVAYGFLLDRYQVDRVNIKFSNLPDEVQNYHRAQRESGILGQAFQEEEFLFHIGVKADDTPRTYLSDLSPGLFNTITFLVANERERQLLRKDITYSPAQDPALLALTLGRCGNIAGQMITKKVQSELARLRDTEPISSQPRNQNQAIALEYRKRTNVILNSVLNQLATLPSPPIIQLKTAYNFLRKHFPEIYTQLEAFIAEDQEESIPLDWDLLVEDWDHTYLLVWLYIILSQFERDSTALSDKFGGILWAWVREVTRTAEKDNLLAEAGEVETINATINFVSKILGDDEAQKIRLRNMASYILKTESVKGLLVGENDSNGLEQESLCLPGMGSFLK